jgi:hypothetical protein
VTRRLRRSFATVKRSDLASEEHVVTARASSSVPLDRPSPSASVVLAAVDVYTFVSPTSRTP